MMYMENLEILKEKYKPIIQNIIDDNTRFYNFKNKVEWYFNERDDFAVVANCGKNLKIAININSIAFALKINQPLMIEYFILHEIRHLYQRLLIVNMQENPNNCPDISAAKVWADEFDNYINMYNDKEAYYRQNIEFDAFAFSYAVMRYKYGQIDYITPPANYGDEFGIVVSRWLKIFKSQNI